jgi:hypothetical protein
MTMNQFAQSNKTFLSQKLQNTMQIFVQMSGGCITLDVHPSDTIRFIKGRIQDLKGVEVEQQVLIHAGKCLIDDRSLNESWIMAASQAARQYTSWCDAAAVPKQ